MDTSTHRIPRTYLHPAWGAPMAKLIVFWGAEVTDHTFPKPRDTSEIDVSFAHLTVATMQDIGQLSDIT